ncbi:MAG: tRNA pseudouridine(38-40) synthase TruA [SAR324 cluster bacterium]|nr:tRNA pseudouridine(38-40) synthase TruA [SAR324 cluster bacterium]
MVSHQNWLLLLSYEGTAYHGWQVQPTQRTIEGELESAIFEITREHVKVLGAGRTDAGVHALNQTASFQSNSSFTAEKWFKALNSVLPKDIVVKHVLPVDPAFHARYNARGKRYRYLLTNGSWQSPFARSHSWWIRNPLNLEKMRTAASFLLGTHDFSSFRASGCSSPSPIKDMREILIHPVTSPLGNLCLEIEASSFLQHMVRILTGTLVDVGMEKRDPEEIPLLLEAKDRTKSGKTAPAHGLYVLKVHYDPEEVLWPPGVLDP